MVITKCSSHIEIALSHKNLEKYVKQVLAWMSTSKAKRKMLDDASDTLHISLVFGRSGALSVIYRSNIQVVVIDVERWYYDITCDT